MSLPLMARENSIIAVGADDQNVEYEFGRGPDPPCVCFEGQRLR